MPNEVSYIHSDTVEMLLRDLNVCVVLMRHGSSKNAAVDRYIETVDLLYSAIFGHGMSPNMILRVFEPSITAEERSNVTGA